MSSNTKTSRYKQVNRQARIQTREGAFSKGMLFTDKPLTEGYSKLLVNYDIDPLDGTLHTRKGLQATGIYPVYTWSSNAQLFNADKGFTNIIGTNTRVLGRGFRTANTAKNADVATDVVTFNTSTNALNVVSLTGLVEEDRLTTQKNVTETKTYFAKAPFTMQPLCTGKDDLYQTIAQTVLDPGIHGQKTEHDIYFRKPVGTFAFGSAYYSFLKHTIKAQAKPEGTVNLIPFPYSFAAPGETHTQGRFRWLSFEDGGLDICADTAGYDTSEVLLAAKFNLPTGKYVGHVQGGNASWTFSCDGYTFKADTITVVDAPIIDKPLYLHCPYNSLLTSFSDTADYYPQIELYVEGANPIYSSYAPYDRAKVAQLFGPSEDSIVDELHYVQYYTEQDVPRSALADHGAKEPVKNVEGSLYDIHVIPQVLNPSEAASAGFNMLADNPYTFECEESTAFGILGVLPYSTTNIILLNLLINQDVILKCYYRGPKTDKEYRVKWEWREVGATQWSTIQDTKINFATQNLKPLECPFRSAVEQAIIRVTISDPANTVAQPDGTNIEYVESTTAFGLNFNVNNTDMHQNVAPVNYNLATATGMLEWKNRLVLWGVKHAETILFTSDVNNPAYFPYPNNIDVVDEPIIHCMLYGDDLLVFTNTKLYRLTIGETGGIGTHTLVQKNLNIAEKDVPMFCLVKNMVFFKSGNYYYMLVPKSSSITGETTIAPVSNSIYPFLDNFSKEVDKLFSIYTQGKTNPDLKQEHSWQYPLSSFLEYYYAYADTTSVVLNFVYDYSGFMRGHPDFDDTSTVQAPNYRPELNSWGPIDFTNEHNKDYCRPKDKRQFILSLIYDTATYAWSIKIYETPNVIHPIYHNAVGQQHYMYMTVQIGPDANDNLSRSPVFIHCTKQGTEDNLIVYQNGVLNALIDYESLKTITEHSALVNLGIQTYSHHKLQQNYQYLDTGYRLLTSAVDIKKRFREVQFSINNVSQKALTFYTAFIVDGNLRKDMRGYTTKMMVNPDDPRTGILLVERPYIDERYLPSVPDYVIKVEDYISPDVTPGDTTLDDTFVLDNTQFPDLAYWKVRVGVSGKGFIPRLQILSVNDKEYSLLSTNWVYRTMNSR